MFVVGPSIDQAQILVTIQRFLKKANVKKTRPVELHIYCNGSATETMVS